MKGAFLVRPFSALPDVQFTSVAKGDIVYRDTSSWRNLPAGSNGQVLTSGGAGAAPSWVTPTGAVSSVFGRTGAVSLLGSDVTGALGYIPANEAGDTISGQLRNSFSGAGADTTAQDAFQARPSGVLSTFWRPLAVYLATADATPRVSVEKDGRFTLRDDSLVQSLQLCRLTPPNGAAATLCGYMFDTTIPKGLVNEATGQILSFGINVPQVGTRDTTRTGGIVRIDSRSGDRRVVVFGYPTGGSTPYERLTVQLEAANVYACYDGPSDQTWGAKGAMLVGFGTGQAGLATLMVHGRVYSDNDHLVDNSARGLVLLAADGNYWRVTISNAGALVTANLGATRPLAP